MSVYWFPLTVACPLLALLQGRVDSVEVRLELTR